MSDVRHLLSWRESSSEFWRECLEATVRFANGGRAPSLKRHLGLLFMNPSLRTRASMEVAAGRLDCRITVLAGQDAWQLEWDDGKVMNGETVEHVREAAQVLSGYFDVLGIRSFAQLPNPSDELVDTPVSRFARHSTAPVINLESAAFHPCQALADGAVLAEHFGDSVQGKRFVLTWASHPRALPMAVPHSTMLMAARMGMHVVVASPPEFALTNRIVAEAGVLARQHGGSVDTVHDIAEAATAAHVIYAKSWTPPSVSSTGDSGAALRAGYSDWRVTDNLMKRTESGVFMHCLPVRRNVIVDDAVLDSAASMVQRQARMRVEANMAILNALIGSRP